MNPIEYLNSKGFRTTSDPTTYSSGEWGLRNYHENGRNMDQYCNGYHRAYDMSDTDGADIPSIADGVVIDGTRDNGTFGGQVVIMYQQLGVQVIYGHVKTPLTVSVGDEVKQGETIAQQGSTNNQGVTMSSHLHIQFQPIEAMNEFDFTCKGIDPLNIDVGGSNNEGSDNVANYKIVNNWVASNMYSIKAPYSMNPNTLTIHETDNNASARNEVAYMRRNNMQVSFHAAIDDKEAVQAIPFNRNAWAGGDGVNGPGNRRSIHLEITYNKDNGYSGPISNRMEQAIENTALYAAHVLIEKGWGTDRLRRHWDWTKKNCPRKLMLFNRWGSFKNRVQQHMDAINSGNTAPAKPKKTPPKKQSSSSNTPRTIGSWSTNRHGTQWIKAEGTFTVGSQPIIMRNGSPKQGAPSPGEAQPGANIDYHELVRVTFNYNAGEGYVGIGYRTGQGGLRYTYIRRWNPQTGAVGDLWGTLS